MLDFGTSFVASVARDPDALAIVDGHSGRVYRAWYGKISALVAAFDEIGSSPAIISSPCCRTIGKPPPSIGRASSPELLTPVNWRAKNDEMDFYIENAEARAVASRMSPRRRS